jgi:hypothetical protein
VNATLANGVGNQYSSHYLGTWCIQLMPTPRLRVVDCTDALRQFKWTRPFRRKTKCGFCACTITFQTQSTQLPTFRGDIDPIFKGKAVQFIETGKSNFCDRKMKLSVKFLEQSVTWCGTAITMHVNVPSACG